MEKVNLNVFCQVLMVYFEVLKSLSFSVPFHFEIIHRDLDNSVFVSFPEICFVLIMYCTPSHMLGHMTSSANDHLYTIKINKDFLMRLLKRGAYMYACIYILSVQERNVDLDPHVATIFSIVPVHPHIYVSIPVMFNSGTVCS